MKSDEARRLILEKLDEVQQILDRWDPGRSRKFFDVTIRRDKEYSRIQFTTFKDPHSQPEIYYDEDDT